MPTARTAISRAVVLLFLAAGLAACGPEPVPPTGEDAPRGAAFVRTLDALADAWNEGDARRAAECFTEDAVYVDPPDRQIYRGRDALFEFFGGDQGRPGAMSMTWHHRAFDPTTGVGFGEFSFSYGGTAHGVAVVRLEGSKIASWREYWYESELPWEEFVAADPF